MTSSHSASRDTRVLVDLSAIAHNTRMIKRMLGGDTHLMAVVKANAYGHGLIPAAKTALQNGASWLGVAIPEEGAALRRAGIAADILVMGNANAAGAELSAQYGLTQAVFDAPGVERVLLASRKAKVQACVQAKLDTGMNRIGAKTPQEVQQLINALDRAAPEVRLTGAFTHFADADNPDDAFTRAQFARFRALTALLPKGILLHAAASDAALRFPWSHLDMVRAGIALYGCPAADAPDLRPALSFVTRVSSVQRLRAGDTVSYGRAFTADKPMLAATLPVGYGDGYHRACSGRAHVLIGGLPCPLLGRVCMDQMMADVTHVPGVQPGDEAVLLGAQGDARITAAMLGEWAGTISYEALLSPTSRVPVIYL